MQALACPTCAHIIQVSDELVGRVARCRGCQTRLAIRRDQSGALALALAPAPTATSAPHHAPTALHDASAPCPKCSASLRASDAFCTSCGAPVSAETRTAIQARSAEMERVSRRRNARQKMERSDRTRRVRRAARVIFWLGVLFCLAGVAMGFVTQSQSEEGMNILRAEYAPEDELEVDGTTWVVRDLIAQVELEVKLAFLIPIGLGVIMFGLYVWALRAPLPATITALAVFLVVQVTSAMVDPKALFQGLLLKGIAIVFLIGGIRAALAERAAEAAEARRLAREAARA